MESNVDNFLVVFCGPSGVGKTTVAKLLSKELARTHPTIHVQTDTIRRMIVIPSHDKEESRFVYSVLYEIARKLLPFGYDVILDGTFLRNSFRETAIRIAEFYRRNYIVVALNADLTTLIERNKTRSIEDFVPETTIAKFWVKFQYPVNGIIINMDLQSPEGCVNIILERMSDIIIKKHKLA